jgi:acetyl esterase/lipase
VNLPEPAPSVPALRYPAMPAAGCWRRMGAGSVPARKFPTETRVQEPSGMVYRNLTQAELDREYNARQSVPSFDAEYARYVAESERAKKRIRHHSDVIYDDRTGETMDIYPGQPGAPVFLWVHGGYWRALSKDDNAFAAAGVVARGLAAAVPNYTLAPAVTLDEIVRQVRKSVGSDFLCKSASANTRQASTATASHISAPTRS